MRKLFLNRWANLLIVTCFLKVDFFPKALGVFYVVEDTCEEEKRNFSFPSKIKSSLKAKSK